jgi:hypothetical protein
MELVNVQILSIDKKSYLLHTIHFMYLLTFWRLLGCLFVKGNSLSLFLQTYEVH